ncbi:hypothetical protein DFH09DRAFT_1370195 [Mycena vulgaris]|nr:hypothetical protein DFH09DRAFT_1370195 [Mycena vulgaris]
MLQIPSSVLSLFSFSSKGLTGLFGGFCIGAQVTFTVVLSAMSGSVPKDSFYDATRTIEIILLPTKCLLSTGTVSFPYTAATAYATVTFASLFYIFRAKGFSCSFTPSPYINPDPTPHNSMQSTSSSPPHNQIGAQPPSPPPDSGSSCSADKTPRRSLWVWILCLIVFILVISGVVGAYVYFTTHDSHKRLTALVAFSHHGLSQIERGFFGGSSAAASCISRFKTYISLHGWQHSKILLVALSSHSVSLLAVWALRRIRANLVKFARIKYMGVFPLLLVLAVISSSSHLSWIFWVRYYYYSRHYKWYSVVRGINWNVLRCSSYLSSLAISHFDEISAMIGVLIIHTSAVCVATVFLALSGFPATIRAAFEKLSYWPRLRYFLDSCVIFMSFFYIDALIRFSWKLYRSLRPDVKQLLWQSPSFQHAKANVLYIFWVVADEYQEWKSSQLDEFHDLTAGLSNTLKAGFNSWWEMWSDFPLVQKLLIAAPAVVFYGYFYVITVGRRVILLIRRWRLQYRYR